MGTRVLGIDYGKKRIGIAYSDEGKILATPYTTFSADKKVEITTQKLLETLIKHSQDFEYEIKEIVVGLPLMMSGNMGLQADEVMVFINKLRELTEIPIITWDERLTSVQAERAMMESGMNRKKRAQSKDRMAAVIILQSYLDSKCIG